MKLSIIIPAHNEEGCIEQTVCKLLQIFKKKSIMHEIIRIAEKQGIALRDSIVEESYQKAKQFPYEAKCSFHRDFEQNDKPDERDLFGGAIVRLGESTGMNVPVIRQIFNQLESIKSLNR